jgi:DNA-binding transcriptional LysR family regulator
LTAHIQQLEEAVGARLLERSNRLSGLTPAGRILLPEARAVLERVQALASAAQRAGRGEVGLLRMGLIPPAATVVVAEALRRFSAELPAVELQLRQAGQETLEARLLAGELDLVIGRPPEKSGAVLRSRRLFIERQGVLLRADDPRAAAATVNLRELAGNKLILLRSNPHFGRNFLDLAAKHGIALTAIPSAEDFPSLQWLVRAGLGVAPCSMLLADTLPAGLVVRLVRPSLPRLEIHALWCGRAPGPIAARLLQMTGEGFA